MSGIFGSKPQAPQVQGFTFPNEGGAAQGAMQDIGALGAAPFSDITALTGLVPGLTTSLFQAGNFGAMPTAAPGIQTAQAVSGPAANLGMGSIGTAQNLQNSANSLVPYAANIAQLGLDPQQQLYNQMLASTQQSNLGVLANQGMAGTPYGASEVGNNTNQFNIAWQNNQLQRAIQGAQGAGSVLNSAGQIATGAQALGQAGAGGAVQESLLPYSTGQNIGGQSLQDLAQAFQLGSAGAALPQMSIQDYLNYLQGGTQAMGVTNQGQEALANWELANQQQQFNMASQMFGGITNMAMLGGAMGPFGAFGAFAPKAA